MASEAADFITSDDDWYFRILQLELIIIITLVYMNFESTR